MGFSADPSFSASSAARATGFLVVNEDDDACVSGLVDPSVTRALGIDLDIESVFSK